MTLLVVAALIVLPWIESDKFVLHVLSLIAIASIVAMGLQVLLGYSGQLSIGQAAFYGIGAYTSALMTTKLGLPFPLALLGAGIAAAVASLLMVPITRLTGAYLAVATLGFSIIVYLFLKNEEWLTGGSYGFISIPRVALFGFVLRDPIYSYYLNVGVAAIVYLTFARIEGSRFGRAINAIRQDPDAARASGLRVTLLKSECFVIAAFVAGLAGSLYAHESATSLLTTLPFGSRSKFSSWW
jgi:branched-chain amino acid transport system permease protein